MTLRPWRALWLVSAVLTATVVVALLSTGGGRSRQVVRVQLPAAGIVVGDGDAPVAVVEFGDILCPPCREFHATVLPEIDQRFVATGRAKFRYVQMDDSEPVPEVLVAASCLVPALGLSGALEWASAAGERGTVTDAIASTEALQGESREDFLACADSMKSMLRMREEVLAASTLGVPATPTLVIGALDRGGCLVGWPMVGVSTLDSVAAYIDEAERLLQGGRPSDLGC